MTQHSQNGEGVEGKGREQHPLTKLIANAHKVYVELSPYPYRKSAYRIPKWRARDQQWAIVDAGCPQFLAINDSGGIDKFRIWTSAEYKEWEKTRGQ